jgi:hypothetical protein
MLALCNEFLRPTFVVIDVKTDDVLVLSFPNCNFNADDCFSNFGGILGGRA